MNDTATMPPIRERYRIRFAKEGLLRWIGHRDLQRLWERMLRRCDVRLSLTEGFHPRPRINLPSALALGAEGLDEVAEIEVSQSITAEELRQRLIDDQQPGMSIGDVTRVPLAAGKAKLHSSDYEVEIPEDFDLAVVDEAIERAASIDQISVQRKEKVITLPLHDVFQQLRRSERLIHVTQSEILNDGGVTAPTLKLTDLLQAIGLVELIPSGGIIRRTRIRLVDEFASAAPSPSNRDHRESFNDDAADSPYETNTF